MEKEETTFNSHPPSDEALVRAFIEEAWNQGDYRNLPSQLAPVITLHFHGEDIPLRVDDVIGLVDRFRNAFPDFNWIVDEAISQGGTVAMRTTFTGSMTGPFDDHPPTGRRMRVSFQLFAHVRDGRIQELWEEYDVAGMRRQLGIES
ncbi:MAG: ester cyclase [Alphaproteobacteria bacterium]|nr:ester cyclase [Alphaproteobacteria bacterium]